MSINVNVDGVVSFTYHNKVRIGWVDFSNDDYLKVTEINLNHTKCFNWAQVSEFRSFGVDAVICEVSGENVKLEVIDDHHIISYLPEKVIKVLDWFHKLFLIGPPRELKMIKKLLFILIGSQFKVTFY